MYTLYEYFEAIFLKKPVGKLGKVHICRPSPWLFFISHQRHFKALKMVKKRGYWAN